MLARIANPARTLVAASGKRQFSAAASGSFKLPDLQYDFGALEPSISAQIMEIHYTKHHQTYITNLNASLEQYEDAQAKGDVAKMIALQGAIKFNGGGHVNHTLFWENLAPNAGGEPEGDLANAITSKVSLKGLRTPRRI